VTKAAAAVTGSLVLPSEVPVITILAEVRPLTLEATAVMKLIWATTPSLNADSDIPVRFC
jgi:hypothetical protein